MKGSSYRSLKYNAKIGTPTGDADRISAEAGMRVNFMNATVALSAIEMAVKQTCDASGVPTIQYPFYLCFGREIWALTAMRQISGESAAQEVAVLSAKWVARGLTQAVLQAIRTDVFSIGAPIAP